MTASNHISTTCAAVAIPELSENFYINNKRKNNVKIQVKLNGEGVYLRRETEQNDHINEQLIRIEDIIGSRCGPRLKKRARGGLSSCKRDVNEQPDADQIECGSPQKKDTSAYIYIYAYVKKEKPLRRNQTVRILRFRTHERYEENLKSAERWHKAIKAHKGAVDSTDFEMQHKQLHILLNPKSGAGKGREMFHKQVAPLLKEAELQYDLQVTTHANFAREFVRMRRDLLDRYCGIVVASGDGLFYEVLNGLMDRADWSVVTRRLPIGIIPCGSGNGLAKSIAHIYDEPYEPKPILNATLTCVSGKATAMDIVRVELAKGDKRSEMYSFLSVGWGIIADIDIESERLRSIGAQRFTLWSIRRLINLRTYKGKVSYLPWLKKQPVTLNRSSTFPKQPSELQTVSLNPSAEQQEFHDIATGEDDDDEFADAISLDRTSFRPHIDSWHSTTSKRTAYYSLGVQSVRSHRSMASRIEAANAELEAHDPVSSIPPLNIPLSSEAGWRFEEGEYILVQAAYTTHLAADCLFAPDSQLNDGIIYLVIIRAGIGRSQMMNFLLSMSSGSHLPDTPNEYIQVLPVTAFRIEPWGDEGIITVDGERVDYGAVQGEIFPGMINVMVPRGK